MSISWPLERLKDARARESMSPAERWRLWGAEWSVLAISSIVLAIVGSLGSICASWLASLREGYCTTNLLATRRVCSLWHEWRMVFGYPMYIVVSIVYAIVAALLVRYAPGAARSGIPELKSYFQGFEIPHVFEYRNLLVKLVGITLVSASGLWLGQEAPLVHIAAMLAQFMSGQLPLSEARRRDLGLAATAAGISVAFGAPIGGVMFALEVFGPTKSVLWQCFVCSMIANVVARLIVSPSSALGGIVVPETGLYHVVFDRIWQNIEIVPFALLGLFGGLYGATALHIMRLPQLVALNRRWPLALVVTLVSATALTSYPDLVSRIPTTDLLADLFAECRPDSKEMLCNKSLQALHVSIPFVIGALTAPIAFALDVPSGILFPTIVIGALGGRLMGLAMRELFTHLPGVLSTSFCPDPRDCVTPGVYALVGAASFLTGVTRLTVSSVVIILEVTGALSFVLPIMAGVIVAKWVSDTLGSSRSVYEAWQDSRKLPSLPDPTIVTIPDLRGSEIMKHADSVVAIRAVQERTLPSARVQGVPILGRNNELIDFVEARSGLSEPTITLSPKASLQLILSTMESLNVRVVLFCSLGQFRGLITRNDVVRVLEEYHQASMSSSVTAHDAAEFEIETDDDELEP